MSTHRERADQAANIVCRVLWPGVSRSEVAARMRLGEGDVEFKIALRLAYKAGRIDFCQGYVVAPPGISTTIAANRSRKQVV